MLRSFKSALALSLCLTFLATGCIGQMGLSGKVRDFNLEVTEDRWGREILFVILMVIPVYGFASIADIIVFNSIEFWTGKNPINGMPSVSPATVLRQFEVDGTSILMTLREDQSIDVEAFTPDGKQHFLNLLRTDEGVVARDRAGEILVRAPGSRLAGLFSPPMGS
jgi:hypothetical protein